MIRAAIFVAALSALASCGVLGPTQADLEGAVHRFYASDHHDGAPDFAAATLSNYDGCQPRGGIFRCPVTFSTGQSEVRAMIWIVRGPDGWDVRNIALNERRR